MLQYFIHPKFKSNVLFHRLPLLITPSITRRIMPTISATFICSYILSSKVLICLSSVLAPVFSERELKFMFAICHRPSVCLSSVCRLLSVVCRLSVTFVHPTQAIEIFGNISTPCGTLAIYDLCIKILRRSSLGNPSVGGVKHKRGSRI